MCGHPIILLHCIFFLSIFNCSKFKNKLWRAHPALVNAADFYSKLTFVFCGMWSRARDLILRISFSTHPFNRLCQYRRIEGLGEKTL